MKDIYIYTNFNSWVDSEPEAVIKGTVTSKTEHLIEIIDEDGLTQIINLDRLFAVVY